MQVKMPKQSSSLFSGQKQLFFFGFLLALILAGAIGFFLAKVLTPSSSTPVSVQSEEKSDNEGNSYVPDQFPVPDEIPIITPVKVIDKTVQEKEIDPNQRIEWTETKEIPSYDLFHDQYFTNARYFKVGRFTDGKYAGNNLLVATVEEQTMGQNNIYSFSFVDTPQEIIFVGEYYKETLESSLKLGKKTLALDRGYIIALPEAQKQSSADDTAQTIEWQKPSETSVGEVSFLTAPTTFYRVGRITGGSYQGYDIIITKGVSESFLGNPGVVRFLVKDNSWILLDRENVSIRADWWVALRYRVDANYMIKDIFLPMTIKGKGQTLKLSHNQLYDSADVSNPQKEQYQEAFTDARLGSVYMLSNDSKDNDGRFMAILPDSTELIYAMDMPFTAADVRWNDGTKTSDDYFYQDVGGCGQMDFADVMASFELDAKTDLIAAGKTKNGETIHVLKDPKHPILTALFDEYDSVRKVYQGSEGNERSDMNYDEFLAEKPVFYWIDPFNRVIQFKKNIFVPYAECGKPVIYLYPEKTTAVHVTVEPKGGMTYSDPPYKNGWNVIAEPSGRLTEVRSQQEYPYLFWEGRGKRYEQPKRGWVIRQKEVHDFLVEKLATLGLNTQETSDFLEFWEPRMKAAPYYFITFLGTRDMDEIAPLTVKPKPDTVIRILMDYTPLEQPISVENPRLRPAPIRRGFTVIEWGGVLQE